MNGFMDHEVKQLQNLSILSKFKLKEIFIDRDSKYQLF